MRILFAILLVVLVGLSGCARSSEGPEPSPSDPDFIPVEVVVYYPDEEGMGLVREVQERQMPAGQSKFTFALECLPLLEGVEVLSVELRGTVAYANFSEDLRSKAAGSTGELLTVYSIVNSLTEFCEVGQVVILIDGKEIDSLSGHMDLAEPVERDDDIIIQGQKLQPG